MVDPTTGLPRLIFGNDQGVWSILDDNGTFETQIGTSDATGRRRPQRQPPDHPVLLRRGPAQQRGRPDRRRPVLRQRPGQRRARLAAPTWSATATSPGAAPAATPAAWRPTSRATARCISTSGPAAAATTPTSSSTSVRAAPAYRPDHRPAQASNGLPTPDPQWPFTGVANFAVNPVNGQRRPHQLDRRPDLRHHQPGRAPGSTSATRRSSAAPAQLQRRPGLRRPRPQRPRGHRQPRQLHLRRHHHRPDLRHPGRRRQRHQQQLAQHLHSASTAPPSSRSSPTRPAAATTPTPSPATGVFYITDSILLGEQPHQHADSGSTSPATSTTWPTRSSARPTTRRPTPTRRTYNLATA